VCCQPGHLSQDPLVGLGHSRLGGTLHTHLTLQACGGLAHIEERGLWG
jgi:hypothetical protein